LKFIPLKNDDEKENHPEFDNIELLKNDLFYGI
jgi:hypothetical protein